MRNSSKALLAVSALLLTAGCQPYRNLDADFGNSVKAMIEAQTYDRNAALHPDPEPPKRMDGRYGESVMPVYRGDVGDPESVREDIAVEVSEE